MATEYKLSYTANEINSKLGMVDTLSEEKADKTEIPTKTSQLTNDSGFLVEVPSEYITESELNSKGFLTEHQDLSNYAKKTDIPSVPIQSVNGQTGAVNLDASDVGALPSNTIIPSKTSELTNDSGYLTSYTETDPTVPSWAKATTKPSYTKSEVGLGNVDNVKQYSASNPPPYPVTKVNNKTGAVTLSASDVGADASGTASSAVSAHNTNTSAHADIRKQISQLSSEKVDKSEISLGIASDGLIYIFINGNPVGTGIPQGQSGDVFGYVDENNTIVLNGNLADGTYNIKYEMEDGSLVEIGDLSLGYVPVYYSVSNNLTLCTTNSNITRLEEGSSYSATITANSGYMLSSIKVVMGGVDITSSAVSGGNISIANVTGNVTITAVAEEIKVSYQQVEYIANSDQNSYVDLGIVNTETTGVQIKYELTSVSSTLGVVGIMGNADIAIGHPSSANVDLRAYWGGIKSYQLMANTAVDTEYLVGVNYLNCGKSAIDGTQKNWNSGTKSFAKNNTITLCKQNGGKNFAKVSRIKIKEVHISEGASVSKHYVPVYRNTDGAIGMLETNSNTFIPATGTFTKGANTGSSYDGSETGGTTPDIPDVPDTPDTPTTGYANQILLSVDSSGNPYNGGQGWKTGYRISGSSGGESAQTGTEVTGFFPVKKDDVIYLKNIVDDGTHAIGTYSSSFEYLSGFAISNIFDGAINGEVVQFTLNANTLNWGGSDGSKLDSIAYMRVSATEITADSIITVNQPIE